MAAEVRRRIAQDTELEALAHPLRLELLEHLLGAGPATASACARAVGDTPSNCSYHLRVLARVGLVGEAASEDGRERPWRALITGFDTPADAGEPFTGLERRLRSLETQQEQRLLAEYLARRDEVPRRWREADALSMYSLRLTAAELSDLTARLDAAIRPYIAATREAAPRGAEPVRLTLHAFPTSVP